MARTARRGAGPTPRAHADFGRRLALWAHRPWHAARTALADWRVRHPARGSLGTRTLRWGTAAICLALLAATLGEAWVNLRLHSEIQAASAQNAWLRRDTQATRRQVDQASAPGTIEDEARARGYIRPGDQPVVVAATQPGAAPPARMVPPRASGGGVGGHWSDWWHFIFGG
ncbi:MAG TPA: hypothetical protein VIC85_14575 [Ktedonobacterales bacterium]